MTFAQFITRWTGHTVDTDGVYPNQCMDLMHEYVKDVLGYPTSFLSAGAAYDVFANFGNEAGHENFIKIDNTPSGVPQQGDIMFWNHGVGAYGHVAIYLDGGVDHFHSFDANWPLGSLPHIESHTYNSVAGWLRPKQVNNGETPMTQAEQADLQAKIDEINNLKAAVAAKDVEIDNLKAQVAQLQNTPASPPEPTGDVVTPNTPLSAVISFLKRLFKNA